MVQLVVSFPGPFRARQQRNIFYGTTYLATPKSPDFPPILHAKSGGNRQNPPNLGEDGLRPPRRRSQRRPMALPRYDLWPYARCKRRIAMTAQRNGSSRMDENEIRE